MNRFIFLDCDGVMATPESYDENHGDGNCDFDPICVEALNYVLEKVPDTKLVISSTWRYGETIESFQGIIDRRGVKGTVVGLTPRIQLLTRIDKTISAPRGCEIQEWLNGFLETYHPYHSDKTMQQEYEWRKSKPYYYLILDDDGDMLYHQRNNFIQTDGRCGFRDVNRAIMILNTPI